MTIERNDLSLDAVKINGDYIEDLVSGYKTIKAVGRELVDREITTTDRPGDGSLLRKTRYTEREINVEFVLQKSSLGEMREYMEKLKAALNVQEAKIIFNGDSDYYFIGTPEFDNSLTEAKNGIIGNFIIRCSDPCKYSVAEKTATASNKTFTVTYNGTYKTYPILVAEFPATLNNSGVNTNTSECGYIGYANQRENVLQFGDPEEEDLGNIEYPATIAHDQPAFKATTGWSSNSSAVLSGTQVGTVAANSSDYYLYPSAYNTDNSGNHGPALSKVITGESSPIGTDFNFNWKQLFKATADNQFGGAEIILWHNDNGTRTMVGAVQMLKTAKGRKCNVNLFCGSTTKGKSWTGVKCDKISSCSMNKVGSQITFKVAGKSTSLTNDNIETLLANEITFHFIQVKSKTAMNANYIYSCQLQRLPFEAEGNVANTFMPGQVLTVNTQNAEVYLDEGSATVANPSLGALGNDWEDFYLVPGVNVIKVDYSTFTTTPPNFTLKYRERFI